MSASAPRGSVAGAAAAVLLLLAGCGVPLAKQFPAYPSYRPEVEAGGAVTLDPYRPAHIQQLERDGRVLQGLVMRLEVKSPEMWTEALARPRIVRMRDGHVVGRVALLGSVHLTPPVWRVPDYLFPLADSAVFRVADRLWDHEPVVAGIPPFMPHDSIPVAEGRWRGRDIPVAGVEAVSLRGQILEARKIPDSVRVDDGDHLRRGELAQTVVVRGAWAAQTDSVRVVGRRWLKLGNTAAWGMRVRADFDSAPETRPGSLADYAFLTVRGWNADSAQSDYLRKLTLLERNSAPVLVACEGTAIPGETARQRNPCLRDGESYLLVFGPRASPGQIPFRIERRGALTSLAVGLTLLIVFLGYSAG